MFKKIFSGLILGLAINSVLAQTETNLPRIIPPSPELSSLTMAGELSAGLHTGSANVNIPLYDIKAGSLQMPVALSYNSNGVRVNDIATRVGMGWNLVAGGNINRTIHDLDDIAISTVRLPPPVSFFDGSLGNNPTVQYVVTASEDIYDTERDEYSYSVNGMSGKFFFDDAGVPTLMSHSDMKIEGGANGFTLTTGLGVKYIFGTTEIETMITGRINDLVSNNLRQKTGYMLSKIISPEGDYIMFTYNNIATHNYLGISQNVTLLRKLPGYDANDFSLCGYCGDGNMDGIRENIVDYGTNYLSSIRCSNGLAIYFSYEKRPVPDLTNDVRLKQVNIYSNPGTEPAKLLKSYRMEYQDFTIVNDINQRFYLKKIYTESNDNPKSEILVHQFDYNDPGALPSQKSTGQDHFGYSNGVVNNLNFFPKPPFFEDYSLGDHGANRDPNFEHASKGILQKVTFPTGGYKEFIYEPHTIAVPTDDSTFTTDIFAIQGLSYNSPNTLTRNYTTNYSGLFKVTSQVYGTSFGPGGPYPPPAYFSPDGIHTVSMLRVFKVSTNEQVWFYKSVNYETTSLFFELEANTEYRFEQYVNGLANAVSVSVRYKPVVNVYGVNTNGCGLRVKQINAYDPVTAKTNTKYYTYASLESLAAAKSMSIAGAAPITALAVLISSGIGALTPQNTAPYLKGGFCIKYIFTFPTVINEVCSNIIQVSSSSIFSNALFAGSPIAYKNIIESDDPDFLHGGIEHVINTVYEPASPLQIIGGVMPGAPGNIMQDINGKELKTTYFKKSGTVFNILQEEENTYLYDNRVSKVINSYVVRKKWEPAYTYVAPPLGVDGILASFDVGGYQLVASWHKLDKTTSKQYDESGLNPLTKTIQYTYNNPVHAQPNVIVTTNSKGETVTQNMLYAADVNSTVTNGMAAIHIISTLVERTETKGTPAVITSKLETVYKSWPAAATGLYNYKPEVIKSAKASSTTESRLHFYNYDVYGNPQELSKENDMRLSYLYNYKNALVVAEVKNASPADIAYTSFEGEEQGNWTFNAAYIVLNGITGKRAFTGQLTKAVTAAKTYKVTAWTKNSVTVNSAAGTLLATHNGWNLYTWTITGTTLVTVSGTNIDEVRLYPSPAEMTTYTWYPFIGVSATCDVNNKITYYDYDGSNRLAYVRDVDRNILKKICYNYAGQPEPCINPVDAIWQLTGLTRCKPCPENSNYITNIMQQQYKDNNTLSPTYNITKWEDIPGVNGSCVSPPDWQNTNTPLRCVRDGDIIIGDQEQEQVDINPCSASAGDIQWVYAGPNLTDCPRITAPSCNSTNCSGVDKKCIEDVCVTGVKYYQSAVQNKTKWNCTYYYFWEEDCSFSPTYYEELTAAPTITYPLACE